MRKFTISLFLCLLALTGMAQERVHQINEVSVINYGDGRLLFRQADKQSEPLNGQHRLIDGYHSEYILAEFKDGMYNGVYKRFKNNNLVEEATYKEGRLNGLRKQYHNDGKTLKNETPFTEGKLNGTIKNYLQSGKLETEKEYKMGIENGCERRYDYQTGKLSTDIFYKDGKPEGKWVESIISNVGNYTRISYYKNGMREGKWSETWENGIPRNTSEYKDGKKEGVWTTYRKDGKPEKSTTYKEDERNGEEITYYTDGKIEKHANYLDGKLNGMVKQFDYETGKVKIERTYVNGAERGPYKIYHPDGTLREQGVK